MGAPVEDAVMALARIVGPIRGDRSDLHVGGELAEHLG